MCRIILTKLVRHGTEREVWNGAMLAFKYVVVLQRGIRIGAGGGIGRWNDVPRVATDDLSDESVDVRGEATYVISCLLERRSK